MTRSARRAAITPGSLAEPGIHLLVARLRARTAGLCAVFERDGGEGELKRMILDPAARGRGAGTVLMHGALAGARRQPSPVSPFTQPRV